MTSKIDTARRLKPAELEELAERLTPHQIHIMAHTLGAYRARVGLSIGWRNRYVVGYLQRGELEALAELGLMRHGGIFQDGSDGMLHFYDCTEAGRRLVHYLWRRRRLRGQAHYSGDGREEHNGR